MLYKRNSSPMTLELNCICISLNVFSISLFTYGKSTQAQWINSPFSEEFFSSFWWPPFPWCSKIPVHKKTPINVFRDYIGILTIRKRKKFLRNRQSNNWIRKKGPLGWFFFLFVVNDCKSIKKRTISCPNCHLRVCAHSYLVLHHTYFQALTEMFFQVFFFTILSNITSTAIRVSKILFF